MLVYFLLISLYFGEYAAHVIVPKYRSPPIDSLDQLWETDLKWVEGDQGSIDMWYRYFGHVSNLKDRHENVTLSENEPPRVSSLRKLANNPDTMVHFSIPDTGQYYINQFSLTPEKRKFYYSKDSFLPTFSCNYHTKDFYAKEEINQKMMAIQDYFLNLLINRDITRLADIKAGLREGDGLPQRLTVDLVAFEHFIVSLIVMGAVYLLAVVILIIEIVVHYIKEKRQSRKEGKVDGKERSNKNNDT